MNDYISRKAAIAAMHELERSANGKDYHTLDTDLIYEVLGEIPAADVQPVQRGNWIPVSERLPENNEAVNITYVNHDPESYYSSVKDMPFTATGVYFSGSWYWWSSTVQDYLDEYGRFEPCKIDEAVEILAWMPLPEPYKKEGELNG